MVNSNVPTSLLLLTFKIEKLFDFDTALLFSEGLEDFLTKTTKKKFVKTYQADEPFK